MANSANRPPHRAPTVGRAFVMGMLAGMIRARQNPTPVLDACGIALESLSDPAARITLAQYAELYNRLIAALDDESFGLFDAPMRPGSFELLCRAVIGSAHLAEALDDIGRYLRILLPQMTVSLHREPPLARLCIAETRPLAASADDPGRIFAYEWLLRLIHVLACWLVDRGLALQQVAFPFPRPAHADDYAAIYTAHTVFSASQLEARFDAALLDLPIRRDHAALRQFLRGGPGRITALYRRDREMALQLRRLFADALPGTLCHHEAARILHLSPRTLHRRLADEGTSFRAIKDELRRSLAIERLAKTRESIAEIAAELGYGDTSAFFRAFVDWTGTSPTGYRARLGGRPPKKSAAR